MQHHKHERIRYKVKNKTQGKPLQKFLTQYQLEKADAFVVFKKLVTEIKLLKKEVFE